MSMHRLRQYFDDRREALRALAKAAAHNHRGLLGTTREMLVDTFLKGHIPAALTVGTGEIIGHRWATGAADDFSGQQDIVIYRNDMPVIHVAGPAQFLIEGVVATIEVKTNCEKSVDSLADIFKKVKMLRSIESASTVTLQMGQEG